MNRAGILVKYYISYISEPLQILDTLCPKFAARIYILGGKKIKP